MSAIPITEKLLFNAGGWQAMKPARELLKSGRVSEAKYEPPLLSGYVREGAKNYRSGLRIKSALDVENICSCWESRSAGKICAHSVAVGLGYLNPPAATAAVAVEPAIPEAPAGPRFVALDTADATPITLHLILPPNFAAAWQRGQVMIVVEAEVSRNRTLVSALPKNATFAADEADLELIEGLRAVPAIFESGMATLSRDGFLRLLQALQNNPRATFGKATRVAIAPVALRPELLVERRGDDGISVKANFSTNRSKKIDHELATASPSDGGHEQEEKALLLWNATDAWLLRNNEFVRCGEALPAGATNLIERPLLLEGDRALHFLAFELPRLRQAFDVRAGEGVRLPEVATALPEFELRLAGTLNSVTGELMCSYGNRGPSKALAHAQDQFVFRDPQNADRVLMRNLDAENAAVARLEQTGFARTDAGGFVLHGQPNVVRFFATDYPRLQRDWKTALTAQVEKWTGEIERVTPKLEIVGSGQDWFEVRYSLTTPGGDMFSNAEIQRLLRSGQSQTRLKNGHLAVIDTAGLEDFEQVIRDCDPAQTQPGLYRINRAHAAYVEQTARELGSAIADRRAALKKFITGRNASPDAKTKLGPLAGTLREYQLAGFEWLTRLAANNLGGILADEMGLGKTVQTLAFLRAHQGDGPALVVCPTSLVTNWENEARKFTPELKTLALEGADRATRFNSIADADIVITSYALLRRDIDTLRDFNFSTAVLDEAQHIKNPETQNAQAAYALRATHRFVLTGTPMENSVRDLWSIMNFALPGYLGNRNDFRERYELPIARGSAPEVQRRLSRRLQPFLLRRRKRDVAKDLPEKIEQVVLSTLTSPQRAAYDALLREIQQGLGGSGKGVNAGAQRMKMLTGLLRLRQVCCDLRLVGIDKEETSAKLDLLDELIEEAIDGEHRVLVFSQFVSMLHIIRERLEKLDVPFCYLDGSTKQRQEIVDCFQSDAAIPVFLISLKAGGVGLNLSAADTVIHFDPWWNPAVEAQATDRAHRIGQTRVVTAYKLITRDTVEEKILRLQEKKRAAIDAAIESEEPLMTGLTTEELEELLA
ncbi:MAG TPA: DEAD/DEAH box helicase [Chthoniobacterales bacterium]|nr:DEAD/DEAH box helicase [Chthoniobacterales bacterium]